MGGRKRRRSGSTSLEFSLSLLFSLQQGKPSALRARHVLAAGSSGGQDSPLPRIFSFPAFFPAAGKSVRAPRLVMCRGWKTASVRTHPSLEFSLSLLFSLHQGKPFVLRTRRALAAGRFPMSFLLVKEPKRTLYRIGIFVNRFATAPTPTAGKSGSSVSGEKMAQCE
jgi:hypothetical protein